MRLTLSLVLFFVLIFTTLNLPKLFSQEKLTEASFYQKLENKSVQCQLCPRRCVIAEGKRGFCGTRENRGGLLYTLTYGKLVAVHIDPIEKKPLFHFLPSTTAYSVATAGCNLRCKFCQNWEISQRLPEEVEYKFITPEELIGQVKAAHVPTIAYTYNEPTVFYEYILQTAQLAHKLGLKNVMHSNGFINEEPLRRLAKYLDAVNIDLKGFNEDYYAKFSEGTLEPVLRSLKVLKEEGVHIELTTLLLSGFNDDELTLKKMCLWIKDNLGVDTPLHFSRFFPMYKLTSLNPTPVGSLERARKIAQSCGLRYVYIGNIETNEGENTYCPKCLKLLIQRRGYFIVSNNLKEGRCKFCGEKISGVWN